MGYICAHAIILKNSVWHGCSQPFLAAFPIHIAHVQLVISDEIVKKYNKQIIIVIKIIKNNIIIIIRTFPECFAPEKFQCKIT